MQWRRSSQHGIIEHWGFTVQNPSFCWWSNLHTLHETECLQKLRGRKPLTCTHLSDSFSHLRGENIINIVLMEKASSTTPAHVEYLEDDPHRAALQDNPDTPEKLSWATIWSILVRDVSTICNLT